MRILHHGLGHRCFHERRRNRIDGYPSGRKFHRHGLGQSFDRVLGQAIGSPVGRADMPHLGTDMDDSPPSRHATQRLAADTIGRPDIQIEHPVKNIVGDFGHRFWNIGADIVDQNVNPVLACDELKHFIRGCVPGPGSTALPAGGSKRVQLIRGTRNRDDFGPGRPQRLADRAADPPAGSRNESPFSVEFICH